MNIEKEILVKLNEDDKQVALQQLKKIYSTVGELHNQLINDTLTEEMKNMLFSLIESYTSDASKTLKYDSKATAEIDKRFTDIRKANKEIHELKKMLAKNTQVDGLKDLLYSMGNALDDWWESQGFNLVTEYQFGNYGFKGTFSLDTRHISFESTRPISEENEHKSLLEEMIDEGYEFIQEYNKEYVLLDTPKNRELLTTLVKSKFKSLEIIKWEDFKLYKKDGFKLRHFQCYIRDLNELKDLIEEMKQKDDIENKN